MRGAGAQALRLRDLTARGTGSVSLPIGPPNPPRRWTWLSTHRIHRNNEMKIELPTRPKSAPTSKSNMIRTAIRLGRRYRPQVKNPSQAEKPVTDTGDGGDQSWLEEL